MTGGLLSVPRPLRQGSVAKLMFLTSAGSVLGVAELLSPVSWELQPFKFVGMPDDDHSRLQSAIHTCLIQERKNQDRVRTERERFENPRAW